MLLTIQYIPGAAMSRAASARGYTTNSPGRVSRIVPVGTMGEAISLRVPNLPAKVRKVVRQIETSRSPDPIMRRPCADREEKRGPAGATVSKTMTDQEQLDLNGPIREGSQAANIGMEDARHVVCVKNDTVIGSGELQQGE